jgi:hypothetical protein
MARVIEFYVPVDFRSHRAPWVAPEQRGRLIEMRRTAQSQENIHGQAHGTYLAAAAPSAGFPR